MEFRVSFKIWGFKIKRYEYIGNMEIWGVPVKLTSKKTIWKFMNINLNAQIVKALSALWLSAYWPIAAVCPSESFAPILPAVLKVVVTISLSS